VRRRRSHAAEARHKGDTPPTTRLPSTSAHSHEYNVSGVVLQNWLARACMPTAHKLYPLRVRVVNVVTGESEWEPTAYIPMVRKQKEPSADLRARERRTAILQRVWYLAFRTTITASHIGVLHEQDGTTYVAFPRLLLYLSYQPE